MIKIPKKSQNLPYAIIGIDPDTDKNGVCIYYENTFKLLSLERSDLIATIRAYPNSIVIIENPSANKPVFFRKGQNVRAMLKIAQNVGAIKEIGKIIYNELLAMQVGCLIKEVILVPPLKGFFKHWKKDVAMFKNDTNILKSNADTRDACALVYNYIL